MLKKCFAKTTGRHAEFCEGQRSVGWRPPDPVRIACWFFLGEDLGLEEGKLIVKNHHIDGRLIGAIKLSFPDRYVLSKLSYPFALAFLIHPPVTGRVAHHPVCRDVSEDKVTTQDL